MPDILRRHKYAVNRILIPAARILSPEFNAIVVFLTGSHVEILRNLLAYATRENTFVDEYHNEYYLSPDSEDWDSISAIVAELEYMLMTIVLGYYDAYCCVRDQKAQSVHGGTFTSGAWRTRDINDEQADPQGICSIASNQITLAPGTYRCAIHCPAMHVSGHQARLYNITDTAVILLGTSGYAFSTDDDNIPSWIYGRFTLAAQKTLEIQHRSIGTRSNYGFGYAANLADELYTIAEFWRET